MRLPTVDGLIRRRILANYSADPSVVVRQLPAGFRPKLHDGHAVVGVCLIRLEEIRPHGLPPLLGISSENAAHRFAIEWQDRDGRQREGVYIPRRDTDSWLNQVAGGRIFPGEHHAASFEITDDGRDISLSMRSRDGAVQVELRGHCAKALPAGSCFPSLEAASQFFARGSLGYSETHDPGRLDGIELDTKSWAVEPLAVDTISSSFFDDRVRFPEGSIRFDHALLMRDIPHAWHQADDYCVPLA